MRRSALLRWLFLAATAASFMQRPLAAKVLDKTAAIAGSTVSYKVVLPDSYDPAKAYPAVLAFPGGPQTMQMVEGTLGRNWRQQAEMLGYIVVIPAAPDGDDHPCRHSGGTPP